MIVVHIIFGCLFGCLAAGASLAAGFSVWTALAVYWGFGTLGLATGAVAVWWRGGRREGQEGQE